MARVAGVNIPDRKHTVVALHAIYGVGITRAEKICDESGVARNALVKDLTEASSKNFEARLLNILLRVT